MSCEFILASNSPQRIAILRDRLKLVPSKVISPDIDETPLYRELPLALATRLARAKAAKVAADHVGVVIVAADTVSAVGRRILQKAETDDDVRTSLELISGRRHMVHTSVVVVDRLGIVRQKTVSSYVKVKRLTKQEIDQYILSKEGIGKSGGTAITGMAEAFVIRIGGSYSGIIGLPMYETRNLLMAALLPHE